MIKLLRLVPQHVFEEIDKLPVVEPLVRPDGGHPYNKAAGDYIGDEYKQLDKDFSPKLDNGEEGGDIAGIIKT